MKQLEELDYTPSLFLKSSVSPRLKTDESIIQKAFYRGKKYKYPYEDITDKVGIRFVVLLSTHIKVLSNIIENSISWSHSKDRDYEDERSSNPNVFSYQSVHYIVKNNESTEYSGVKIPAGTSCEIQVRTLLQHAYSELSHDSVYKTDRIVNSCVERWIARSMALIETTDDTFVLVNEKIEEDYKKYHAYVKILTDVYALYNKNYVGLTKYTKMLDYFIDLIDAQDWEEMNTSLPEHNYSEIIQKRQSSVMLYKTPVIIALFYAAINYPRKLLKTWPFERGLLDYVFTDLGISMSD